MTNDYYTICFDTSCTGFQPVMENENPIAFGTEQEARSAGYDCNPYTGKWNFHLNADVDACIDHIQCWFLAMMQLDENKFYGEFAI